jgi:16S rRNA (adenine1518-N6/adenine1519-N6)-dimethyltransferase
MVRPKKALGQHFLTDHNIARKIAGSLSPNSLNVLEIGPGTGMLTRYLSEIPDIELKVIEIDKESIIYLKEHLSLQDHQIIHNDFLEVRLSEIFQSPFRIIGNLPYNISSQIFFKVLENRDSIPEVVAMIQKEVARRIASRPGNKEYGILSVLLQAFYQIEYLFTVNETVFNPPPKVKSAVIRLKRNHVSTLNCDEDLFFQVVKTAFNQRRKTLRNSLKSILLHLESNETLLSRRPEELSVEEFVGLTRLCGNGAFVKTGNRN